MSPTSTGDTADTEPPPVTVRTDSTSHRRPEAPIPRRGEKFQEPPVERGRGGEEASGARATGVAAGTGDVEAGPFGRGGGDRVESAAQDLDPQHRRAGAAPRPRPARVPRTPRPSRRPAPCATLPPMYAPLNRLTCWWPAD